MSAAVHALPPLEPAEPETVAAYDKVRLALAGRIAAGLVANPQVFTQRDWQGAVARDAWAVADKLLLRATTGGC